MVTWILLALNADDPEAADVEEIEASDGSELQQKAGQLNRNKVICQSLHFLGPCEEVGIHYHSMGDIGNDLALQVCTSYRAVCAITPARSNGAHFLQLPLIISA